MLYIEKPKTFDPLFDVVSCFVENRGKILLLLRQDTKPQGNTWGVPAGKREKGESIVDALRRELKEETGMIVPGDALQFIQEVFVSYPEYDFCYHMYKLRAPSEEIVIDPKSHKAFRWVKPTAAKGLPLIGDLEECINLCY